MPLSAHIEIFSVFDFYELIKTIEVKRNNKSNSSYGSVLLVVPPTPTPPSGIAGKSKSQETFQHYKKKLWGDGGSNKIFHIVYILQDEIFNTTAL